jgi:hypothetical protein
VVFNSPGIPVVNSLGTYPKNRKPLFYIQKPAVFEYKKVDKYLECVFSQHFPTPFTFRSQLRGILITTGQPRLLIAK